MNSVEASNSIFSDGLELWLNDSEVDFYTGLEDGRVDSVLPDENQDVSYKNALKQAQDAAYRVFSDFPSVFAGNVEDSIAHRKRMWKTLRAHELEYWNENQETLRAVIQAFETTAPTLIRDSEKKLGESQLFEVITRARSAMQNTQNILFNAPSLDKKPELDRIQKICSNLLFFEGVLRIITKPNVPLEMSPPSPILAMPAGSVFAGATKVDLYGDSTSLVWRHKTLYCVMETIPDTPQDRKTRVWVDWKPCDEAQAKAKVCVFCRASDWRRDLPKLALKAVRSTQDQGWRTFEVSLLKKPVATSPQENLEVKTEPKSDDTSVLARLAALEKRVAMLEGAKPADHTA